MSSSLHRRPNPFRGWVAALLVPPLLLGGCDDPVTSQGTSHRHFEIIPAPGITHFPLPTLNDRDEVAFNLRDEDGTSRPALYRQGELLALPLSGDSGRVVDLNDRGDVLGYDPRPVLWMADGTVTTLERDTFDVVVGGVNDGGVVVGSHAGNGTLLRWQPGGAPEILPLPPGGGIALNDPGDIVNEEFLLLADGTRVVSDDPGNPPDFYAVTNDRTILGSYLAHVQVNGVFDEQGRGVRYLGPTVNRYPASINEAGDVAWTLVHCEPGPGFDCTRWHRFLRADGAGGNQELLLDTFPEFAEQDLQELTIVDVNDSGVLLVSGFRPSPGSGDHLALYRHPALAR